jgi:predicted nucleic acid-binding protein
MISCDTNILFIALESSRPGHVEARRFLEGHQIDPEFALCELVLLAHHE